MSVESEKEWLLEAIEVFFKRFFVVSPQLEILAASRSTQSAFQDNIIGQKCHDLLHDRSSPCINCPVEEAMAGNEPIFRQKPGADGKIGRISCNYTYPIYRKGHLKAFASMEFDLPTREGVEEVLQRSNTFLHKLLASAVDAIIAADKKGHILIFNEMAAKILGYDAKMAHQEIEIRDLYPDDMAYEVMKKLRSDDHGGKGNLRSYQVNLLAKNGVAIPISLNASIVYEGDEEIATIGFFHDMREELRMKAELEKTQIQLLQAEKMASLGMLAAGVAHEINNPLAVMIEEAGWMRDLLDDGELQTSENLEEFNRALKQIDTQGKRCKEITNKLLSFSRQSEPKIQSVQINEIIEEVVALSLQRAKKASVKLKTKLQKDLPTVQISLTEMQQVLVNLINNAMDALETDGGTVTVSSRSARGLMIIEVADDGHGIPSDELSKIFDPFFTTKPVGKGTGLGLFICYFIIKTMGGRIDVNSIAGVGTTFIISIPI